MLRHKILLTAFALFLTACTAPKPTAVTPAPSAVVLAPAPAPIVLPSTIKSMETERGNKNMGLLNVGEGDNSDVNIEGHSYRVISLEDEFKKLLGVSTYVILPNNLSAETDTKSEVYLRYARVLTLVQYLDKVEVESNGELSDFYENENIFVLFSEDKNNSVTLKNYDYTLSNKVLKRFRKAYSSTLFREEGPYLVTTIKNIWNGEEDFSFLYVNLTNFNKSAVDEMIGSYKERLIESGIDEVTTFEKWHSRLLSFVTNFSSDIRIFQTAVAGGLD